MEDTAAVIGVIIAGSCMGLTSITGNPMYDSIGALGVGTLLGAVSGFLIYTNTMALTGRSIPDDQLLKLSEVMENDVMIRQRIQRYGMWTLKFSKVTSLWDVSYPSLHPRVLTGGSTCFV
eukprot:XP_011663924.1 PREDICTED: zinc transporter 9-like [Strongylocentrotus purpuratus]